MMVHPECILVGTLRPIVLFERAAGQVNLYVPLFFGQEQCTMPCFTRSRERVIPAGGISSQAVSSMIGWH